MKLKPYYLKRKLIAGLSSGQHDHLIAKVAVALLIATGYGCSMLQPDAKPESVADANQGKVFNSISDITCQPLVLVPGKDKARVVVNEFTARLKQPSGITPVLAYQIPRDGLHRISIDSFVVHHSGTGSFEQNDNELFYPEVALLDEHNVLISKVDPAHVAYKAPGFTTEEGVGTSFSIDNRGQIPDKTACLLIYTTDSLRKGTTTLINEEKEYAKVRGVVPPPVPDPVARHGDTGHLLIKIKSEDAMQVIRPVAAPVAATVVHKPAEAVTQVLDKDTEAVRNHYVDGVKTALAEGNISEALDKRAELRLVTNQTEEYFLKNYGKTAASLSTVQTSSGNSFAEKARNTYIQRIGDYFKAGKGSAALQLLDEVKQLQSDVDHLFDR